MKIRILFSAVVLLGVFSCSDNSPKPLNMYVGTFTREGGKGIHSMQFDPATGAIAQVKLEVSGLKDPSFICYSPDKSVLYAYNNVTTGSAEVIAYRVDAETRALTEFSKVETPTQTFCYISTFDDGKYLGLASYNEGTSYAFPLNADGSIVDEPSVVQHVGSSIHPRQAAPHAHLILQEPQTGNVYIPDLGLDKIIIYSLTEGKLDSIGYAPTAPGAGPRHIAFHDNGRFMAALNELDNTVVLYTRDAQGLFTVAGQAVGTVPADFDGQTSAADIHFSRDGKALYTSNRGHNSVTVFAFDPESGAVENKGWITEGIDFPRNFAIDPTGKFLLVANQNGADIVVYAIGNEATELTFTGHRAEVVEPVCILF